MPTQSKILELPNFAQELEKVLRGEYDQESKRWCLRHLARMRMGKHKVAVCKLDKKPVLVALVILTTRIGFALSDVEDQEHSSTPKIREYVSALRRMRDVCNAAFGIMIRQEFDLKEGSYFVGKNFELFRNTLPSCLPINLHCYFA